METSSRKALADLPPITGAKRPAESTPTLLPAFEPVQSSPSLPRPVKRVRASPDENHFSKKSPTKSSNGKSKYPTPVPTSSTGMFSSSPPQRYKTRRPRFQRTTSNLSERAPLASVPAIELDITGEPILMGRSCKSSHYQMSTSKYISRVHVRAAYLHAKSDHPNRIEIVCLGSNGIKIQCQGKAWELAPEDSFTSESQDSDIMVDVAGARVILRWPVVARKAFTPEDSEGGTDRENSPHGPNIAAIYRSPLSSPLRNRARLQSPVSPSPAGRDTSSHLMEPNAVTSAPIKIYEDAEAENEDEKSNGETQPTQPMSQPLGRKVDASQEDESDLSDRDEENEPLVHSMGSFGDNLLPRMASFTTQASPGSQPNDVSFTRSPTLEGREPNGRRHLKELCPVDKNDPLLNHVVNQLAYSRLSSVPLSTLLNNLPSELRDSNYQGKKLELVVLKALIESISCIGEVSRAGKDAAGKALESEYYYIPENDFDLARRAAVVDDLRKPGLRSCRKQHKVTVLLIIRCSILKCLQQYFWRKPK